MVDPSRAADLMARWVAFGEAPLGPVEAPDKERALERARRQYGPQVTRVQSAVSLELGFDPPARPGHDDEED